EKFKLTNSTRNSGISAIAQDETGKIWFIADYVLKSINPTNGELLTYTFETNVNPSCLLYTKKQLYIGTNNGFLKLYNPKSNNFSEYNVLPETLALSSRRIEKLYASGNNKI